jgi:hypothetical protein
LIEGCAGPEGSFDLENFPEPASLTLFSGTEYHVESVAAARSGAGQRPAIPQ